MEEEAKFVSRLQEKTTYDVVIRRYDYLVRHVNAIRILPHLVSSELVEPDFSQYLEHERTDKDKMATLLRELLRIPMEGWFKYFIGALSRFQQYEIVIDTLLAGNGKRHTHGYNRQLATFLLSSNVVPFFV